MSRNLFISAALLASLVTTGQYVAAQPPVIKAYSGTFNLPGWTVADPISRNPVIGPVPVTVLLVDSRPAGVMFPCFSGGGAGPQPVANNNVPVALTGCGMTIMERPITAGAVMTIVSGYMHSGRPGGLGTDTAYYEATPPLSGPVTLTLQGASVLANFPATITLNPTTTNYVP